MKYLLLIYRDPASLGVRGLLEELAGSGELVAGAALADPVNTRTFSGRGGVPATTDRPYAEAGAQLTGYLVVDCEDIDRASEIAAGVPGTRFTTVEVRPIMDLSGQEM
ncbi:YciI family protein [Amycolatopsis sp. H20-H5]|uniref:YciI family protein n=1 Tax=Amycolatopsis sp. H20-H5 TaxID=3046309 RepID=UPI002DB83017|nr:YciI family protein [Amycolatopsis sp. H20-H5]MEC3981340.1 YciI family protein [Amycolatopsis sp. H20-H5]